MLSPVSSNLHFGVGVGREGVGGLEQWKEEQKRAYKTSFMYANENLSVLSAN